MRKNVEIITFVKSNAHIREDLKEFSHVRYIEDCNSLLNTIDNLDYMNSYVLIIDFDYTLSEKKTIINDCVKHSLVHKGFSILLYSDRIIPLEMKIRFYNLDFKGIIDAQTGDKKKLLTHVLNRSNLHAASFRNNSIRGMLEFHNLDADAKNAAYLLDYIVYKYNISYKDASDIHLVLSSLIIAFNLKKIIKVEKLLHTIYKSKSINNLYQNYMYPKSMNGSYIAIILKLLDQSKIHKYLATINMKNIDAVLFDAIENIYKKKFIYISSLQDINSFWEQLNNSMVESDFLSMVYELLFQSLLRVDFMRAYVAFDDSGNITVFIDQFEDKNDNLRHYIELHSIYLNSVTFNEDRVIIKLKNQDKALIDTASVVQIQDKSKISAQEFLKDYNVDKDVLDDLAENEEDISTLLYLEEHISQQTIENVSIIFHKYANILFETVEFEKLAIALSSLSYVLKETPFESVEKSKKETLRFYIQGLIDDLQQWKQHVFVEQNTPDIHYMDDSLLENCSAIEVFINAKQEEDNETEDEDDLEFF